MGVVIHRLPVLLHVIGFGLALLVATPEAAAAPARRHKPGRVTATPSAVAVTAETTAPPVDVPLEPPAPKSPVVAGPEAAPPHEVPAVAPELEQQPVAQQRAPAALVSAETSGARLSDAAAAALGREEAARVAAGRVGVAVWFSVDIGRRHFSYSDPVGPLLAPYRLAIAPMASFGLEAYPFASSAIPALRDLGFRGRISRAFALDSTTPDGEKIETSWTRFGGEVRQRLLIPGQHPLEVGLFAGADASYFGMATKTQLLALLPSARAVSLRFGLDARWFAVKKFSFLLGGAYLVSTSAPEIYQQFRDPQLAGVDAELGCALGLTPDFEARLMGRYTRYFASFQPVPGDRVVAGGALDEQMQLGLGVRYAH